MKTISFLRRMGRWIAIAVLMLILVVVFILCFFRAWAGLRERVSHTDAAPASGHFVHAADLDIFVQEAGPPTGPAVLFVHGTGAWSEIWKPAMTILADKGFHVIALDLPPFGFSQKPETLVYGTHDQAQRILGVLDALHIDRATLVGHSFGSRATLAAVLQAPTRIRSLVLVDAAIDVNPPTATGPSLISALLAVRPLRNSIVATLVTNPLVTRQLIRMLIFRKEAATDDQVRIMQQPMVVRETTNRLGEWLLAFIGPDDTPFASLLPSKDLTMPILLLWGEQDFLTPLEQGKHLASLLPTAELVTLKGVGHIPHIEDPAQFNDALLKFVEAHRNDQ